MTYQLNAGHAITQFLFSTVRLRSVYPDGSEGLGTAFFFDLYAPGASRTYLVTNKHVLAGADETVIDFHVGRNIQLNALTPPARATVSFRAFDQAWFPHPDPDTDLCVLAVDDLKRLAGGQLDDLFYRQMGSHGVRTEADWAHMPVVTGVAMIGYPIGLWDEVNNLPIVRLGHTATHPSIDFNGRPEVLVDMACFPGSSGSPVVYHALELGGAVHHFLGILYGGAVQQVDGKVVMRPAPIKRMAVAESEVMIHLGYVIKGREIVRAMEECERQR